MDSPPPRASGEGGILYTEFREEACVSHLGGEDAKKSMSPVLTDLGAIESGFVLNRTSKVKKTENETSLDDKVKKTKLRKRRVEQVES